MSKKEHKKRGRKPKTNIIVNNNPVFKNNNFNDIIICINNSDEINNSNEIIIEDNFENIIDNSNSYMCENCTIKLSKKFIELPINYNNNIFYVCYKLCSLECAHRYCYDNFSDYNEKLSLLHLYYNKISNSFNKINIAKPTSVLCHNGGNISINEYRKHFNDIIYINQPYTLDSSINIIDNKDINNNKIINLKLYRTNKINKNKNNIFNKMNLDISSR